MNHRICNYILHNQLPIEECFGKLKKLLIIWKDGYHTEHVLK